MQHLVTLPQPEFIIDTEHWIAASAGDNGNDEWGERRIFDSTNRLECVLDVPYTISRPPQIGESEFAPDTWLIAHRQTTQPPGGTNMNPDLSDLKTIATVISVARPSYNITLVGVDSLTQGGTAYHLSLRPVSDPKKHNLRELWINTASDNIMRAIIEGDYRPTYRDVASDTFVLEDFGLVGPYWLVIHHVWTYRNPFSGRTVQYNATSTAMRFLAALPNWFFDVKLFEQHRGDVLPVIGP